MLSFFVATTAGMGQHVQDLANPEGQVVTIIKVFCSSNHIWSCAVAHVSKSLCLLLRRFGLR